MTPRGDEHSPNWGGARPGGGRKPTGRKVKTYALVLPPDLVAAIDAAAAEQGASRSRVVADILRAHFGLPIERAAEPTDT